MKEFVRLPGEPELMRNSLIFTGLTLRTFSAVVSTCFSPLVEFVHTALPTKSPLKAASPGVTLKVALTLAPGATGSVNVFDVSFVSATSDVHCTLGGEILSVTPFAGEPVEFVKVTVVSCEEPGVNV